MITRLGLKNFRCFQDITLDGIRPITLLAGQNGIGKSSILESIFLFIDRDSNEIFIKLNNFRGITHIPLSPLAMWEHLFYKMDTNKAIEISISHDNEEEELITLAKDPSFSLLSIPDLNYKANMNVIGLPLSDSYALKLSYTGQIHNRDSNFTLTSNGVAMSGSQPILINPLYTHYFHSRLVIMPQIATECFSTVDRMGKISQCLNIIQSFDPRIKGLSIHVSGGMTGLVADIGESPKISVNMLGDGFYKLLTIILVMLARPGSIILIDEIENGFHYSFLPKLWDIIGKATLETGCQVIATTHSYECIRGASGLATDPDNPELFRFIRLDRNNGQRIPKKYDNDTFEYALENEWEVR